MFDAIVDTVGLVVGVKVFKLDTDIVLVTNCVGDPLTVTELEVVEVIVFELVVVLVIVLVIGDVIVIFIEPVDEVDRDDVLLFELVFVFVPDWLLLFVGILEPDIVFVLLGVALSVGDAVKVLELVTVLVPLGEEVPVFDEVIEDVAVLLINPLIVFLEVLE